jgi:hypothetical protein
MTFWTAMLRSIADVLSRIVLKGSFGLTEHVVGIRGRELHTDTHASIHQPGRGSLKNRVGVKLDDWGKSAGLRMMACMKMMQFQHDAFQLRARVLLGHQESHPHVVYMVIDNEHAIAEAMGEWDIHHMAPNVRGKVQHGAVWFRASSGVAGCINSLAVQA